MIDIRQIPEGTKCTELPVLLASFDLTLPKNPDVSLGIYDDGELIGCGFLKGNMLQGLAVDDRYQGEGLSSRLVTELIKEAALRQQRHLYVITKPSMADKLSGLGLRKLAVAAPYAAMFEFGSESVRHFSAKLKRLSAENREKCAALVMNCNPFTMGHRYLIEKAASENEKVYVLIVEEDLSEYTFDERFMLAKEGVKDLANVTVIPSGPYVVSSLTFPTYFTKEENLAAAQSALDAELFGKVYVPALNIAKRYVGSEPTSVVTNIYNQALARRLPKYGVEVIEIPRLELDNEVVSASTVRAALQEGNFERARKMLPETTWNYLKKKPQ